MKVQRGKDILEMSVEEYILLTEKENDKEEVIKHIDEHGNYEEIPVEKHPYGNVRRHKKHRKFTKDELDFLKNNSGLTITKLSKKLGINKNTLSTRLIKDYGGIKVLRAKRIDKHGSNEDKRQKRGKFVFSRAVNLCKSQGLTMEEAMKRASFEWNSGKKMVIFPFIEPFKEDNLHLLKDYVMQSVSSNRPLNFFDLKLLVRMTIQEYETFLISFVANAKKVEDYLAKENIKGTFIVTMKDNRKVIEFRKSTNDIVPN